MHLSKLLYAVVFCYLLSAEKLCAQTPTLEAQAEETMLKATRYMVENVSTNGGYVWYYLPDLSRRWGEMEAYKSMVWVQDGGTVTVGQMLLDAYHATGNEYLYEAAEKAAGAMIRGQSKAGGWNYMIDFAGEQSLKKWYNTIGKNGWRLEEFQHYYGNDTYDDDVTSSAARFMLRMYIERFNPKYKVALDKAIRFLLSSQYPAGGWPQRFPLKNDFSKAGHPDYTGYYTFNDDVIWENVNFLIQCYYTLGDQKLREPIERGMNFYLLSQQANGAWGQQYNMKLEPAGARTYEPAAYLPRATFANAMLLLKFYQYTGDRKYLTRVPDAIAWLEKVRLPDSMSQNGYYTHSLFVEVGTDKPIFVHRRGSNVTYGRYYVDYNDGKLLGHMQGKGNINIQRLKDEYTRVSKLSPEEATKNSPLKISEFNRDQVLQRYATISQNGAAENESPSAEKVAQVISQLSDNRWLVKHAMISNPYVGDGKNKEATDAFASTRVGDITDTSPYPDASDQLYLSTPEYIKNMRILAAYIRSARQQQTAK
ncbi:pectate lyase [Segetibacter sp. 3557_3]|uniref:pectate lyase n=1 Tax=Segetibacter sp. 3557_3 TaxID=2547429 RepID=UPI001058F706|nr:pectate lyase [Segetibacter sp. 3557_3]TDH21625.1 pectate lyase [Segetibacter sp. 3557_3]